jgi:hypothetical protein
LSLSYKRFADECGRDLRLQHRITCRHHPNKRMTCRERIAGEGRDFTKQV